MRHERPSLRELAGYTSEGPGSAFELDYFFVRDVLDTSYTAEQCIECIPERFDAAHKRRIERLCRLMRPQGASDVSA